MNGALLLAAYTGLELYRKLKAKSDHMQVVQVGGLAWILYRRILSASSKHIYYFRFVNFLCRLSQSSCPATATAERLRLGQSCRHLGTLAVRSVTCIEECSSTHTYGLHL